MRKLVDYTPEKFVDLMVKYHKGQFPNMHWGQILYNEFVKGLWPELFYEDDDRKANEMFSAFLNEQLDIKEDKMKEVYIVVGVGRDFYGPVYYYDNICTAHAEAVKKAEMFPGHNIIVCKVVKNIISKGIEVVQPEEGLKCMDKSVDEWMNE